MDKPNREMTQLHYENLLTHIVLPRVLPFGRIKGHEKIELSLLTRMNDAVQEMAEILPEESIRIFANFHDVHKLRVPENISNKINELKPGGTFAMFVRRQNTAFMIHMPNDGNNNLNEFKDVIVSTFPGNLHPKEINDQTSDVQLTYPSQALKVKYSQMMRSEEFATQLCFLYDQMPMDTKNRNYVNTWLTTILSDENTQMIEFQSITKKIRDEIHGTSEKQQSAIDENVIKYESNYFRRSNFYQAMKVILQHSLTMDLGEIDGKCIYKIVMLQFMTKMLNFFVNCKRLDIDLIRQLMAKVARRIEKLTLPKNIADNVMKMHKMIVCKANECISSLRKKIDKQINDLHQAEVKKAIIMPLKKLDFGRDVYQKVPKLRDYLEKRQSASDENQNDFSIQITSFQRHKIDELKAPDANWINQFNQETHQNLALTDFENFVLYRMQINDDSYSTQCEYLQTLTFNYSSVAETFYHGDQLGISKMLLVRLKLLAIMDRIVVKKHPLYGQHRSGVDPSVFNILLLPHAIDMKIAHELEMYFTKRNNKANDPGLIEETKVTKNSFAVKFVNQNSAMQTVLNEIHELAKRKIEEKRKEWIEGREEVARLEAIASRHNHQYYTGRDRNGYTYRNHCSSCYLCELESQIANVKIEQYERPLPEGIYEQRSIVFELLIPTDLADIRDVLFLTTKYLHIDNNDNNSKVSNNWIGDNQISSWNKSKTTKVNLGRTTKTSTYKNHVRDSFESFIIQNVNNCTLYASWSQLYSSMDIKAIKNACTLKIDSNSSYANLQWTLNTTDHYQNQVIAKQSECSQELSLTEFKEFGSLRADGHRLQLRKLYAMIATEKLSFDQTSVLTLIQQTIWENGCIGEADFIRESHVDFNDPTFSSAMIDLLKKFVEQQKDNWVHPIKLLIATLIAVRIFELNNDENVANQLVVLLNKLRNVLIQWMSNIEKALQEMADRTPDKEHALRTQLVIVAMTGALTFFVNSQHQYFDKIFSKTDANELSATQIWFQSIVKLNNNNSLYGEIQSQMQSNLKMLLRCIRNTGIHIETKLKELIKTNPTDVIDFIKNQWALSETGKFDKINFHETCPQVLIVYVHLKDVKNHITIDTITGTFLVNNLPVARLPENITGNAIFQRIFRGHIFEVQPAKLNSFTTVYKYNNCSYEFAWSNNALIVTEHQNNGIEIELIPPENFKDEIPELLIENFSHWWHKFDNTIEFRPIKFVEKQFSNKSGIAYKLNMKIDRLIEIKTGRRMLDITSKSYQRIRDHLMRLEREKFIHVLINKSKNVAEIELVRLRLKFNVDGTNTEYTMISNEFNGMRVSLQQNCGTLYGLNHGLLLESAPNEHERQSSKLLILPHSTIQSACTDHHMNVQINLNTELRNPSFYQYQVDESLRQLKANNSNSSAWFYLAHLHAVTSHGEIEPLIGMSGTERALQILQSSFVWSSEPFDDESIKTLCSIATLTPKRQLKENIQQIEWPKNIQNYCAQDSFIFIVKKLIEDSERLNELHFRKDITKLEITTDLRLNIRDYQRCVQMMANGLRVQNLFIEHSVLQTATANIPNINYSCDTRTVSSIYHRNSSSVFNYSYSFKEFLTKNWTLDGPIHQNEVVNKLNHVAYLFHDFWISIYEVARKQQLNEKQFALLWSLLAHEKNNIKAILALQTIARSPHAFETIHPPDIANYQLFEGTYDSGRVKNILNNHYKQPSSYYDWSDKKQENHNDEIEKEIVRLTNIVTCSWPCDAVNLYSYNSYINEKTANVSINQMLLIWNNNRKLNNFLNEVECRLRNIVEEHMNPPNLHVNYNTNENWPKFEIDFKSIMFKNLSEWEPLINEAETIWQMKSSNIDRKAAEWWKLYDQIFNSKTKKHLIDAGIYPRMVPSLVLPQIISDNKSIHPKIKSIVGTLALTTAHEQRLHRIEMYKNQPKLKPALDRELANKPHVNWKPCNYPEWLLFEIEQNLTIREIQIKIAQRMIEPPDIGTKHSVMQLNMGEGKTAVIVPILASILANGEQACQITVLKSLFATNLKSLRQYLGGMLNKRIYTFPCRRDMPVAANVEQMLNIYKECMKMKGVILTLPEYRLSFQLKIYESIQNDGNLLAANNFLTAHKWINSNVRSILDESDAILHAKYQLIYTIGNQLQLDGGTQRWTVIQAVLKNIPNHMKQLYKQFGEEKIEFNLNYIQENGPVYGAPKIDYRSDVFTPCRIIDESIYDQLKNLLIEDFIDGRMDINFPEMNEITKEGLRKLLSQKENNEETTESVLTNFESKECNIVLILCGLIKFEVLKLILKRRWRVNYGVNENSNTKQNETNEKKVKGRKMAIPFKAKDVAAEMTEFGHSDVAIGFTQLSYYYSGLNDHQLYRVFDILKMNRNAAEIYERWISQVPSALIEHSIRSYSGVNLNDPTQRTQLLFPIFRYNMYVIDFWLSNEVFPREAKTFEKKLICTAWDLVSDHMDHRVTGFSGTNDTKHILPLPIAQNDLDELEQTNENVRQTLLQRENQVYKKLNENVSGKEILEQLRETGIPVLLDSGALMLELNNEEMAKEWLKLMPPTIYDAAIFFDTEDILQTIDRNGILAEFDCSVYRHNLERCLVYLDDVHTRGTDLKFPLETKACVTLSGDITRDKTVQACMRMRQLGKGHSIAFWASHEADIRLRDTCELKSKDVVTNEHVIEFICKNSERFELENTVHWAAAGYNYAKKLAAHKQHETNINEESLKKLYDGCVDDEYVTLQILYGDKCETLLIDISNAKFEKLIESYHDVVKVMKFIEKINVDIYEKLQNQAPNVKRFKNALDEEQEKELEQEQEEERQIERPPGVPSVTPNFNELLIRLFLTACTTSFDQLISTGGITSLNSSLKHTQLFQSYIDECPWSKNSFVTQDFICVIEKSNSCDAYLRPVWWIATIPNSLGKNLFILLSSFECDRLISTFQKSKVSALFMYRPRLSRFHDILLHDPRLQITGMKNAASVDLRSEIEIHVYAGSMYFKNDDERNAFCSFLGLIPRPRTDELEAAFECGLIQPNGYVLPENRKKLNAIAERVGDSKFKRNPVDLIIKIICAHHEFMREESHVGMIFARGIKHKFEDEETAHCSQMNIK